MTHYGFVKCAISTFNGKLANPTANRKKIESLIDEAAKKKASILVFPELSLTGYSCQDLFETSDLINLSMENLKSLVLATRNSKNTGVDNMLIIVGAPIFASSTLFNCAIAIQNGHVLGVVPKQYIPNYSEFYEKRWFTPYTDFSLKEIDLFGEKVPFGNIIFKSSLGYNLGIEICEDLWSVIPPSSYLALNGADIICNLSASNELVGKEAYRKELVKTQSSRTISAYLYTSAGFSESTSDIVFGGSGYIFQNGKELTSFERFQTADQLNFCDVDIEYIRNERNHSKTFADSKRVNSISYATVAFNQVDSYVIIPDEGLTISGKVNPHPFIPDIVDESGGKVCKEILSIQATALARRLSSIGCKTVTIGISGGLDSTLALLVCFDAFNKLKISPKGIIGITMPGFGTTNRTYNNSVKLCNVLGITLREISIKDSCMQHFKDIGHDPAVHDITYENVQARERTKILMDVANKENGIVVGTGDLSELVLGWCTYNGDHMSMYGVNCSIPKTLVRYLIEWYAKFSTSDNDLTSTLLDIVDTPISPELLPTDGKKVVQKTESTIGPYEVLDFFIYHFLRNRFSKEKIVALAYNAFNPKYTIVQLMEYYNNFIRRFFHNQFKRNCIPDGPKVGSVSVSPRGDLRMPSDADVSEWLFSQNVINETIEAEQKGEAYIL